MLVNLGLSFLAVLVDLVLLFFGLENLALGRLGLLGLDAVEECVIQVGRHVDFADVDLGAGGDDVDLIDASQWAAVQFEWATNEQQARFQLFQEDNTFASMTTGDQDEDGAWRDRWSQGVLVRREGLLVGLELSRLVFGRVGLRESSDSDVTSATVLVALDLLLDDAGRVLLLVLWLLLVGLLPLLDVPETTLVEHATARQAHDAARFQLLVDRGRAGLLILLSWWCHFCN